MPYSSLNRTHQLAPIQARLRDIEATTGRLWRWSAEASPTSILFKVFEPTNMFQVLEPFIDYIYIHICIYMYIKAYTLLFSWRYI